MVETDRKVRVTPTILRGPLRPIGTQPASSFVAAFDLFIERKTWNVKIRDVAENATRPTHGHTAQDE